jgi:hypothetical protein
MRRAAARASRIALLLFAGAALAPVVSGTGCGGAKHAKIVGPPPEYEPPESFDAGAPDALGLDHHVPR